MNKQRIFPHLWFDTGSKDAAEYYMNVFPESKILSEVTLSDTPSGDSKQMSFEVYNYKFMAIDAGPYFVKNPSISFTVLFKKSELDVLENAWHLLSKNGNIIMDLDTYDFSEKYGWVEDQFGVSWQLIITEEPFEERIRPSLLFNNDNVGRAEEAIHYYTEIFKNSESVSKFYYPEGMEPNKTSYLAHSEFKLENQYFIAMDSAFEYDYSFNEGISLMILVDGQDEIDYYWDKLSAVPEAEQCGWLKDKFGVSWQVVPSIMNEFAKKGTPEQMQRVTQAFLKMKKFNIAELEKAFEGQ
ncbi:VOC family protein [Mammaliicoccus stepanovicii]|uniref:3-demethylubiquinone-9 3-methyltransferase domain protein n=1 Tax=Mammaliicoccus stepanovicii TaxID=643214 RepID=A0A239YD34_9STAP|nr:VOC family protein [Mammaliicoccus stepanovicii]PNZ75532.1 VOC family protein [Mammaliicoccus stepanovicii]GGI42607.1 VOC family protein [Mammaliicoccus stepanovicii]SNV56602.1 3-demethylubiquinone-9 3-methyltransferase domain protein [Mammaliicoccus stepanovicii]